MYVYPNTNIKIYSGIPLDNSYENTLWFNSLSDQNSYFHAGYSHLKHTLTEQSYQRVERGKMRVAIPAESLYDCNYLAFQNRAFGYKWFYAFILGVEYVNNETTEITFEIDVMQTYLFDVTLKESFIEREHASVDGIGDNLVEENLELGEYMITDTDTLGIDDYVIVLMTSAKFDPQNFHQETGWDYARVSRVSGTLCGNQYYVFPNTEQGLDDLKLVIYIFNTYAKPDQILGLFMLPQIFVGTPDSDHEVSPTDNPVMISKSIPKKYGSFDGYTPRNNKLYTFPYNFLYVTNMSGNHAIYPYEYFSNSTATFLAYGTALADAQVVLFPAGYKGSGSDINKDEFLLLSGFPQCSYNIDTYKAWLAQNSGALYSSIFSTAVGGITGALALSVAGGGLGTVAGLGYLGGTVSNVSRLVGQVADRKYAPIQTKGVNSASIMSCCNYLDFVFMNKRIRSEYARIIDDYFDKYGYATHKVKTPNRHVRERWTYTKTVGCNAIGECPADDIKRIKQIYDNGITFWVNPSEVGSYSLSNRPL